MPSCYLFSIFAFTVAVLYATVMCSYCPTIVKDNISSLLYSVDKYSNRTYTNGYTYKPNDVCSV